MLVIYFVIVWYDRNCFEKRVELNGGVRIVFCLKLNYFVILFGSLMIEFVNFWNVKLLIGFSREILDNGWK